MNGTHVLVAAIGQLGGRGVHEGEEASEQQQREIGARARHGRRIWPSTKDSRAVYYWSVRLSKRREAWPPHQRTSPSPRSPTTTPTSTERPCTTPQPAAPGRRSC